MGNRDKSTYNTTGLRKKTGRVCKECSSTYEGIGKQKYCSLICSQRNEYTANMEKPSWRLGKLLANAKHRANLKILPFDLDPEFLEELWEKSYGCCSLTKTKFNLGKGSKFGQVHPDAPSIDRIIPEKGYTKGNVRLVTYHTNVALSEFGFDKLLKLAVDLITYAE